jgi:hypothetical protein
MDSDGYLAVDLRTGYLLQDRSSLIGCRLEECGAGFVLGNLL